MKIKSIYKKVVRVMYVVLHYFGCPEKHLTQKDHLMIRACHKCSRLRFGNKDVEERFNRIMKALENNEASKKN